MITVFFLINLKKVKDADFFRVFYFLFTIRHAAVILMGYRIDNQIRMFRLTRRGVCTIQIA